MISILIIFSVAHNSQQKQNLIGIHRKLLNDVNNEQTFCDATTNRVI
ncbi:hypothetical protein QNI22_36655 [Cytophagaceae bacterium BD1B2-1]|uniref:Uncharacterized protein n=1 Tax=Xanthocytophaga agilis TaxID=3048010 RepID=A0AAE3UHQ4_9BACT|nr:hypothetical protein [Xanthocytophaga agilis]